MKLKARAKINLTLEVLDKREDNYHNLKSIFQKINLYDEIYLYKSKKYELITNVNELKNENNIIYKTFIKLKEKYNIEGVKVILKKKIPMQAGLAGGSTDCASFIVGMNKLFKLNMSEQDIISLGSSLGADVVPCLYNKALLAEGIGNKITKINTKFKYYIVIIKPNFSCNTKEMFNKLDNKERKIKDNTEKVIKSLENNDIYLLSNNLYNTFENVVDIKKYKQKLMDNNAINAVLTGSGSCVYGIFKNKSLAQKAYNNLKKEYETYICSSYNK